MTRNNGDYVIPVGEFEPLAMETGGRLHPRTLEALKTYVKATCLGLNTSDPIPLDQAPKYNRALRMLLDTLAVPLARQVARALLHAVPDTIGDDSRDEAGNTVQPGPGVRVAQWRPHWRTGGVAPHSSFGGTGAGPLGEPVQAGQCPGQLGAILEILRK